MSTGLSIDHDFYPCPVCGRKPIVSNIENMRTVSCRGGFFKRHRLVAISVFPKQNLIDDYRTVLDKWNNMVKNW